jgi:hypothetical protein
LIPLKAAAYRPHALYIFVKRVHLFIEPRLPRLHIVAAQLIECLTDGEFVYFSHRKILGLLMTGEIEIVKHGPESQS